MKVAGLTSVRYRSRKPPAAWRGSPAEQVVDLGALDRAHRALHRQRRRGGVALSAERQCRRRRRARRASASTRPQVELVADPAAPGNVHEIEAEGAAGRFAIQLEGRPSRSNPKTSALAAMSVARALLNADATIVI